MSNGERGRKLLAAAREHLAEMEGALSRSSWNIAVRRAQEVVELALKAVLTYLCIDYPKVQRCRRSVRGYACRPADEPE